MNNYAHQHCIKQTGLAFHMYAEEHNGQLPFSTNGFGNALLLSTDPVPMIISEVSLVASAAG